MGFVSESQVRTRLRAGAQGFEPPVPLARFRVIFGEEKGPQALERRFLGGDQRFESLCSSAESGANLAFGNESHR